MPVDKESYNRLHTYFTRKGVQLVAVSKTKPITDIMELYDAGQRDFGENYVQELMAKQTQLPADIRWHFIGHLQSNKIKYIASFVHLIHGVDSLKLLLAINKEAVKTGRVIHVLLQMHIAREETKFGFDETELNDCLSTLQKTPLSNVSIAGFMGMASFLPDEMAVRDEFKMLRNIALQYFPKFNILNPLQVESPMVISMGMSNDYQWAIEEGSTMVRIGSLLFGSRQ
jgi:pyridoxal phosphate enzyme (YggS family)